MKKNIFLIGFMGSGKSTVAKALAELTRGTVIEMDEEIVREEGLEIPQIFATKGETYFRSLESDLLRRKGKLEGQIVSCGGGVPMREENVRIMREHGVTVLLLARPETILERVKDDDGRPLLQGKKNVADISQLMEQRRQKYEACAEVQIVTDDKTAVEIAEEILERLK